MALNGDNNLYNNTRKRGTDVEQQKQVQKWESMIKEREKRVNKLQYEKSLIRKKIYDEKQRSMAMERIIIREQNEILHIQDKINKEKGE